MITAPSAPFFFLPYDSIAHLLECNLLFSLAERMLIVFVLIGFGIKSRRKGERKVKMWRSGLKRHFRSTDGTAWTG